MNYVVFDLEATCWKNDRTRQNEIIEIGAVLVNEDQQIVDTFEQFVRPIVHPQLSDFCTELTSITQAQVDGAPAFEEAVANFQEWFGGIDGEYLLCSWGFYDKSQLKKDCILHGLDYSWTKRHISVKHQYAKIKSLPKPVGMPTALEKEGFALEGTHHRGIDDAKNIAKIFVAYYDSWKRK